MPLYEYQCEACGHRFETIRKFSDAPLESCPKCGGALHKLQSAPAFQFKGSGWYITDYAKKDAGKPAANGKNDGGTAGTDSADKGAKSDSAAKPASGDSTSTSTPTNPAKN